MVQVPKLPPRKPMMTVERVCLLTCSTIIFIFFGVAVVAALF